MAADGVRRALAFVTSAYGSYSGCRQYLDNIANARQEAGPGAPVIDKLRVFYNHPGFIETMIENTRAALEKVPIASRDTAAIVYTAHSIPLSMAQTSPYVEQLEQASQLVNAAVRRGSPTLVYQSRSGPPSQAWLEPDICGYLRDLAAAGGPRDLVVVPIGFISDHLEVLYDLDTEVGNLCGNLGLRMQRAATAGVHPRFVQMIREDRPCGEPWAKPERGLTCVPPIVAPAPAKQRNRIATLRVCVKTRLRGRRGTVRHWLVPKSLEIAAI
jgi:ferrochelatase